VHENSLKNLLTSLIHALSSKTNYERVTKAMEMSKDIKVLRAPTELTRASARNEY
jgi:hypothetical protein